MFNIKRTLDKSIWLKLFRCISSVGYKLLTKRPHIFDPNGERDQDDVMHQYKNPEGM